MKMKKLIITTLSLIVLSACSDNSKKLVGSWLEVTPPGVSYEQGMAINEDGTASSIGMETLKYSDWKLDGKSFMISGKSIGNGMSFDFVDTMKIAKLSSDSLILKNKEYEVKYYRQK